MNLPHDIPFEAWRDGRLDQAALTALAERLRADPELLAAFVAEARLDRLLRASIPAVSVDELVDRVDHVISASGRQRSLAVVMERIADTQPRPVRSPLRFVPLAAPLLAAAAVLLALWWWATPVAGPSIRVDQHATLDVRPVGAELRVAEAGGVVRWGVDRQQLQPLADTRRLSLPVEFELGADGWCRLELPGGGELRLGGGSRCGISGQGSNVVLHHGSLAGHLPPGSRWLLTPQALATVGGAEVQVSVAGDRTRITNQRGSVSVQDLDSGEARELPAGGERLVHGPHVGELPDLPMADGRP